MKSIQKSLEKVVASDNRIPEDINLHHVLDATKEKMKKLNKSSKDKKEDKD